MNITKTDYKTLKFEEKPLNVIRNFAILPLTAEGLKQYCEKDTPANRYIYKPHPKMVQNIYDKRDNITSSDNFDNVFKHYDESNNKIENTNQNEEKDDCPEDENLIEEKNPNVKIPNDIKSNILKEKSDKFTSENKSKVGFQINDCIEEKRRSNINNDQVKEERKIDQQNVNDEGFYEENNVNNGNYNYNNYVNNELNYNHNIPNNRNNFLENSDTKNYYRTSSSGFMSSHKRSTSNIFKNNSNGVERILGSNEINFRCTTNKEKMAIIYNNSIKSFEKMNGNSSDTTKHYKKELEGLAKKIETPNKFFGVTPSSNLYTLSKRRREKSLEGKGIGFESFNVPRTASLNKTRADLNENSHSNTHCKNISNSLRISTGLNRFNKNNTNINNYNQGKNDVHFNKHLLVNSLNIDYNDGDENIEVLCKNENSKLRNIIFNINGSSNFNAKLPKISQIVKENKKWSNADYNKKSTKQNQFEPGTFNFNNMKRSSSQVNSFR